MARPAAILLLLTFSAQGQAQTPAKASVEPAPGLRPAISLPTQAPQPAQRVPAAKPAASQVQAASRPAAVARTSTGCRIQAGTFGRRANADDLAKALKPLGEVRVNAMQLAGKPVHLVTIVGLRTRKDAELTLDRLETSGRDLGALRIVGCGT